MTSTADKFCPRSGKIRHATKADADDHAGHLRSTRRGGYTGRSYPCRHCGGWHVGTDKAEGLRLRRRFPPGGGHE